MKKNNELQQEKLQISDQEIEARIENMNYGGKLNKDWAKRWLDVESKGQVGLSLFPMPPIFESAKNDRLFDVDGKEYVDLLCGFSVSTLGHNNEEISNIIKKQSDVLTHNFDFPHPERIKLSEKLVKSAPINSDKARVVYGVTGSDAVELALRAARYHTGKSMVLSAYGDYHGVTYGTMPYTTKGGMRPYFYPIQPQDSGVGYFPFPYSYRSPFGEAPEGHNPDEFVLTQLENYLNFLLESKETPYGDGGSDISNVAAIIVEPFQSSAGYYIPPKGYLKLLRDICDKHDILLIVDEIQTGLGRTGKLWATDWEDVKVDMLLTSKALGGGIPLSAVVSNAEILESWGPGAHVSTQAGNVLACAAGNYVLNHVSQNSFLEEVSKKGEYFVRKLSELQEKYSFIGKIDSRGLYIGVEIVKDRKTKEPGVEFANAVLKESLNEGIVFEKGGYFHNRLQLIPPLTITYETIDLAIEKFNTIFERVTKK